MAITTYKQGQTIQFTLTTKDYDGTVITPDATPVGKVYFGTTVKETLTVSGSAGVYTALHSILITADVGAYTVVFTWAYSAKDDLVSDYFRVESYL